MLGLYLAIVALYLWVVLLAFGKTAPGYALVMPVGVLVLLPLVAAFAVWSLITDFMIEVDYRTVHVMKHLAYRLDKFASWVNGE